MLSEGKQGWWEGKQDASKIPRLASYVQCVHIYNTSEGCRTHCNRGCRAGASLRQHRQLPDPTYTVPSAAMAGELLTALSVSTVHLTWPAGVIAYSLLSYDPTYTVPSAGGARYRHRTPDAA